MLIKEKFEKQRKEIKEKGKKKIPTKRQKLTKKDKKKNLDVIFKIGVIKKFN